MTRARAVAVACLALVACEQEAWLGAPVDGGEGEDAASPGARPCLAAEPARLVLGTVAKGETGRRTLGLRNRCDAAVEVAGFVFGGDPGFSLAAGDRVWPATASTAREGVRVDPPLLVPRGETLEVEVRYEAAGPQAAYASLVFRPAADDAGPAVTAEANTAAPCVATSPKAVDFGGWAPGGEATRTLTVASCGKGPLLVQEVALAPGGADAFSVSPPAGGPPWEVAPGETLSLDVAFAPDAAAPKRADGHPAPDAAALVLRTNAFRPEHRVELSGYGVEEACPRALATADVESEVPPGTIATLDGTASYGARGPLEAWTWAAEAPGGAPVRLDPSSSSPRVQVRLGLVGRYRFTLDVRDATGPACVPAEVVVDVVPPEAGLLVELSWRTPGDPDPADVGPGAGADLDLHLLHPLAVGRDLDADGAPDGWFDLPFDANWSNPAPDWGVVGEGDAGDDPRLDRDDVDGGGPESVTLAAPQPDAAYRVGVHGWDDHGYGPSVARVRIWADGEPVSEPLEREILPDQLWEAATIAWPAGAVAPCEDDCVRAVSDMLPGK